MHIIYPVVLEIRAELSKFPRWLKFDLLSQNNSLARGAGSLCSFSPIGTRELTLMGRESMFVAPQPSSHTNTCLFETRIKPDTEVHTLLDRSQMLLWPCRHQQAHKGWFPSLTYPSVFSALSNPYTLTQEFGFPVFGEPWGAPEESDRSLGISLSLVTTRKSEKSKVKTHTGKLKPTCMSTGENDRRVVTIPTQQNSPEQSAF